MNHTESQQRPQYLAWKILRTRKKYPSFKTRYNQHTQDQVAERYSRDIEPLGYAD